MKLTIFLASFAAIDTTTASPPRPTNLAVDPEWALPREGAAISWDPADAYVKKDPTRRWEWQNVCSLAVARAGCVVGVIHKGETNVFKDGKATSYINVEGAPSKADIDHGNTKKMRVFQDGSSEDMVDWPRRDRKMMKEGKRKRIPRARRYKKGPPPERNQNALLFWDPADAYKDHAKKKLHWEHMCDEGLTRAGCGVGLIHQGQASLVRNGETMQYVLAEGAQSVDMMKNSQAQKMRVFHDGSTEALNDWSRKDRTMMADAKRKGQYGKPQPQRQKALIFWYPHDAYDSRPRKKLHWENLCDITFTREGCDGGIIHKGETQVYKPDGKRTFYVNVEAAPSAKPGMENGKRMRVFKDGSYSYGWSAMDEKHMKENKRMRRGKPAWEGQKAVLSWKPTNAYENQKKRKWDWEQICHQALDGKGCSAAIIHQGDTKVVRNGTKTSYVNVEGSGPDFGGKHIRVFQDGSSEVVTKNDLSARDRRVLREAERLAALERPVGPAEAGTSTQEPAQEDGQGDSKRRRIGPGESQD